MSRKKQIEEMAKTLNYCCNDYDENGRHIRNKCNSYDCEYWSNDNFCCCSYGRKEAEALYNAGYRKASDVAREIIAIIEQRIGRNTELKAGIQSSIWQSHYEGCIQAYTDIKEIIEQKYTESEDTE